MMRRKKKLSQQEIAQMAYKKPRGRPPKASSQAVVFDMPGKGRIEVNDGQTITVDLAVEFGQKDLYRRSQVCESRRDSLLPHSEDDHYVDDMTCTQQKATAGNYRRPCKHEFCQTCAERSMPPRTSAFWICCHCGELNEYKPGEWKVWEKERYLRRYCREHYEDEFITF